MRSDLRLAWRVLVRRPLLSAAIVATIGMAIAATAVAFAVVNGVLLRPLPYAEPRRLVAVWERNLAHSSDRNVVSPANFFLWHDEFKSFDRLAAGLEISVAISGDAEPEQVGAMLMSASYFGMVGAKPVAGRLYTEEEDVEGGPRVVMLSERFWRRKFGADPAIVGKSIVVNGSGAQVVGVLPTQADFVPRFRFSSTGTRDVWLPPQFGARARTWGGRYLQVIGRLAPGRTAREAEREAGVVAEEARRRFPERQQGWDIVTLPLQEEVVGDVRPAVLTVFGAVCLVLLIACSNVASLLLTRATERHQEMAVRSALGAGRALLMRQLFLEGAVLSVIGGGVGLAIGGWGVRLLVQSAPDLPRLDAVGIDLTVVGFVVAAVAATAILFGLAPIAQLPDRGLASHLTQRNTTGSRGAVRVRSWFVVGQLALSFMLLVGAGLLVRSLSNRLGIDVGFPVERLLTAEVSLRNGTDDTTRAGRFEQMVDRVAAIPGIRLASAASIVPMSGDGQSTSFEVLDRPPTRPEDAPVADVRFVHRDYIRTIGIPLLAGRPLGLEDRAGSPIHVLINQTGARLNWPGEPAVGKRIRMAWGDTLVAEVVGVVGDVRLAGPDSPVRTTLYWDHRQAGRPYKMSLVIRSDPPAETIVPAIRAAIREIDPTLPLYNVRPMTGLLAASVARARFTTVALGVFATLALALAGLGLYGVLAYATQQREREIGIRLALGAGRRTVVGMVLRQGLVLVAPALALGAVGALLLSRLLRTLVFGVTPTDPITFVGVALLLSASSLLACWLPARRASGLDPVIAMRAD